MTEQDATPFRAVAMGPNLPLTLRGSAPAIALADVKQFRVMSQSTAVEGGFEALYAQTVDKVLRGTGTETFEAIDMLRKADPSRFQPENGADYPKSRIGQTLQQVAQLLKADIGREVGFVDTGGWDNHVNEGGAQGQMANLLRDMGQGLAALHQDLGDRMEDIVVVTMSEFRRTAHENGKPRNRSRLRELHVCDGRSREGRKSVRQVAGARSRTIERRPRPRTHDGFPLCPRRSHQRTPRHHESPLGVPEL